ncbi:MAG TPA: ABC transporter substrate-binding protein [Candidatus Nanopelagicaceae bacterium]|nr:ABC transporter substrate-binding protein [Candidatus Nanopelagicaceae bacterium]
MSVRSLRLAIPLSAVLLVGVLPPLVSSANAASHKTHKAKIGKWADVNVGIALTPPKMVFLAPYIAQARGLFRKAHLRVKFIGMPDGLETELGTVTGAIDLGFSSATDGISSASVGTPLHTIWSYAPKLDTVCIAAPDINSATDLIGQNVASTGTGGFSYTQVDACLVKNGVKVSQVNLINMKRSQFVGALASNQVKAAVFHVDDAYVVTHQVAGLKVLDNEYLSAPDWWYGGVAVLDSWAKSHKSAVERFLTVMVQTDRWMSDPKHKPFVMKVAAKATQEDPAALSAAYDFIVKGHLWTLNDGMDPKSVLYTEAEMAKFGEIDRIPTYNQIVDTTYINDVLKKIGRVAE